MGSAGAIQNGKGRYGEVPEVCRLATAVQVQTLVIGDIALGGAERGIPVGGVPIQDALTIHGVSIAHMGDAQHALHMDGGGEAQLTGEGALAHGDTGLHQQSLLALALTGDGDLLIPTHRGQRDHPVRAADHVPFDAGEHLAGAVPCGEGEGGTLAYILLYGELIHGDGELGGDVHCQTGGVIPQCSDDLGGADGLSRDADLVVARAVRLKLGSDDAVLGIGQGGELRAGIRALEPQIQRHGRFTAGGIVVGDHVQRQQALVPIEAR